MGRLFSGSILPIYWKLLIVKIVLKHMVHFFNAYSVHSSCIWYLLGPVAITGSAAIIDGKKLIFPSTPFLAGGNSLLEPKTKLMHTDATYVTCDMWNYVLEWYQVVLGCLRVHTNVFTKIAITEVNISHRPKIAILWFGPNCTHFRQLLWGQFTWCEFDASTTNT